MASTVRFDGAIAGLGSGLRAVVGHWPVSPFDPVTDVMVQDADGARTLLAPSELLADLLARTYVFDDARVVDVTAAVLASAWSVRAGPLQPDSTWAGARRWVPCFA